MAVKVTLDYEETANFSDKEVEEVKKKLAKIQDSLCKKLPPYLEFLTQE